MNIIGINVKRLRKLHNLNQVEFAQMVGVSQGSLSDIESGKSKTSVETVIAIHERFHCSLEWLLTGKSNKGEFNINATSTLLNINSTNEILTSVEEELIRGYRALDHENQFELLEIIKLKGRKRQLE